MSKAIPTSGLAVYERAVEAAGIALSLAVKVPAPLRAVGEQLVRSASSVPANLAEGHSRTGRDRAHLWRIAYGSAREVDCHLQLLVAVGAVNQDRAENALKLFDQVRAMTWRLLYPGH